MTFEGASDQPAITGLGLLPGDANFLIGNDASGWKTGVPTFSEIRYEQLVSGD